MLRYAIGFLNVLIEVQYESATIPELIIHTTDRHSDAIAAKLRTKSIQKDYTYSELYHHIIRFCRLLASNGIARCKVALIGGNGYEWLVAFLSICASGNTAVLIDAEASDEEWIRCSESCPAQWVICLRDLENRAKKIFGGNCISFYPNMMEELGGEPLEETNPFSADITPQSDAAVVFTSGTSGANKGVLLSHRNLCSDIKASLLLAGVDERDDILAVLPPHHAFQLVTGLLTPYYAGMSIYFGKGLMYLKKDLTECRPSMLVLVPLIVRSLEKQIQNGIQRENRGKQIRKAMRISNCLRKFGIDIRRRLFA